MTEPTKPEVDEREVIIGVDVDGIVAITFTVVVDCLVYSPQIMEIIMMLVANLGTQRAKPPRDCLRLEMKPFNVER